jgi:hypothetical protein
MSFVVKGAGCMFIALFAGAACPRSAWARSDAPVLASTATALFSDAAPPTSQPASLVDGLSFTLDFHFLYGGIDGYVQTPSGGNPGTTSLHRPTLAELGFDNVSVFDVSLATQAGASIFFLGAQIIELDGSATLSETLITQSAVFPAGTHEHASVQLDWYRFGYEYQFTFDLNDQGSQLRVAPGIEGVLLDFDYQITAAGGLHAHRSYAKAGVSIGGSVEWLTGTPLSFEAQGFWGLPIDSTAQILNVDLVARWQLWGARHAWGGAAYLGAAYEHIEYEDNQTVPNHINVDLGPMLIAGLQITF